MEPTSKLSLLIGLCAVSATFLNGQASSFDYGGFVSAGYLETSRYNYLVDSEEGSFEFAEMGVNAWWSPFDRTTVNGQIFAFELGPYGNYEPLIDYLFVDYSISPSLGIRAGRVKRPQGVYNEIQDLDLARPSILLPMGLYDQRYRDFTASVDGLSLYGSLSLGGSQRLDYNAYHGRIDPELNGGVGAFAEMELGRALPGAKLVELDAEYNSGFQLWWQPSLQGLRFGISYADYPDVYAKATALLPPVYPPNPAIAGAPFLSESFVEISYSRISLEYFLGDWTFVSEYEETETDSVTISKIGGFATPAESDSTRGGSWYVSGSRRFLEKFEGSVTYAEFYSNIKWKKRSGNYNQDLQFSLRYQANDFWSVKLEHHLIEGTNRLFNQHGQNTILDEKNWTLFAAKTTFAF